MHFKITKVALVGLMLTLGTAFAQKGITDGSKYGHGEDSIRCLRNLSLYNMPFQNKNYEEAYPYWLVVFNECPASHVGIYSDGEKMISYFYEKETDPTKKEDYYKLLMRSFEYRIKYFGDHSKYPTDYIKGIQASTMLRYKGDDGETIKAAYKLFTEAIAVRGDKTQPAILLNYMSTAVSMFQRKEIDATSLIGTYSLISGILEKQKMESNRKPEQLDAVKTSIESLFGNSGAATCEVIESIYSKDIEANKANASWLKQVNFLLSKGDCTDSQLFFKTSEYMYSIEPTSSSAFGLAKMYLKTKDIDKAIGYYNEAISLETDALTKSTYLYQLGLIYMAQNNYSQARANATKALASRPNWGAPYILIGKAYAATASSFGSNEFEHKTAYWAAVDQFIKARNVDPELAAEARGLISQYSQYFPNTESIFFQGLKEGASYKVEGWINETTTVRANK